MFMGGLEVKRLALNMDQVTKYGCPANPAKLTDSRADAYIAEFGRESWELDALEPKVIADLVRTTITKYIDMKKWKAMQEKIRVERQALGAVAANWKDVKKKFKE
jgi:hypothetical protein